MCNVSINREVYFSRYLFVLGPFHRTRTVYVLLLYIERCEIYIANKKIANSVGGKMVCANSDAIMMPSLRASWHSIIFASKSNTISILYYLQQIHWMRFIFIILYICEIKLYFGIDREYYKWKFAISRHHHYIFSRRRTPWRRDHSGYISWFEWTRSQQGTGRL